MLRNQAFEPRSTITHKTLWGATKSHLNEDNVAYVTQFMEAACRGRRWSEGNRSCEGALAQNLTSLLANSQEVAHHCQLNSKCAHTQSRTCAQERMHVKCARMYVCVCVSLCWCLNSWDRRAVWWPTLSEQRKRNELRIKRKKRKKGRVAPHQKQKRDLKIY